MIQNTNPRHEAYCAFMRRHRETVWRVCWHFARHGRGDRSDRMARTEDMAQEVWIVLWLKFDQLNPEYNERQQRRWLERLARSVLIDLYRRADPEPEPITDEMADTIPLPGLDYAECLYDLLAALPPEEEQLMRLRLEGYDAAEIAARTGLSRDTIYQRINRIMKKLRIINGTD
ncbi:MAG: sigma-70 family RNA polymerase sigma factor [Bacteroidales bacterium]|nr:sigma-70 family RNA polymerase sigma factor [Bacteroidales bacterium]